MKVYFEFSNLWLNLTSLLLRCPWSAGTIITRIRALTHKLPINTTQWEVIHGYYVAYYRFHLTFVLNLPFMLKLGLDRWLDRWLNDLL